MMFHSLAILILVLISPVKADVIDMDMSISDHNSQLSGFLNISDSVPHMYRTLEAFCAAHNVIGAGCCGCWGDCKLFMTCCAENHWLGEERNNSIVLNDTLIISAAKDLLSIERRKDETCEYLLPPNVANGFESNAYLMVASCQENTTAADQNDCYDVTKSFFPVLDSNNDVLYRNEFCAKCNGVDEFMGIGIRLKCKNEDMTPKSDCFYSLDFMDSTGTLCFKSDEQNESKKCKVGHPLYDLCVQYNTTGTKEFNYFCKLCEEGYNINSSLNKFMRDGCMDYSQQFKHFDWFYCYSLTEDAAPYAICDFTPECPQLYWKEDNRCKKMSESMIKRDLFDTCYLKNDVRLFFKNPYDLDSLNTYFLPFKIPKLVVAYHDTDTTVIKTETFINDKIKTMIKDLQYKDLDTIIHPDDSSLAYNSALEPSHIFSKKRLCAKIKDLLIDSNTVIKIDCNVTYMGKQVEPDNLLLWARTGRSITSRHLSLCSAFYLPLDKCRLESFNSSEVKVLTNLSLVHVSKSGKKHVYDIEEYVPLVGNKFGVCFKKGSDELPTWHRVISSVQLNVSLFGTILSVISYLLMILLLCFIKEAQSNHHFCIFILCLIFMVEDILYFVLVLMKFSDVSISSLQCKVIGFVNHFTGLFVQFWLCVFTVSVSMNVTNNLTETVRIKRSLVLSSLLTFVFVLTAFIFSETKTLDAKYEHLIGCFLTGFYSQILLHLVPVMLCIVTSLAFLCSSYWLIRRNKGGVITLKSQTSIGGSERVITNNFLSLMKIVLICGFIDIVSFIRLPGTLSSTPEDSSYIRSVFALLYALTKGLRGLVLFLIVICRKEIITIYKMHHLFRAKKMSRVETGRSGVELSVVTQDNNLEYE